MMRMFLLTVACFLGRGVDVELVDARHELMSKSSIKPTALVPSSMELTDPYKNTANVAGLYGTCETVHASINCMHFACMSAQHRFEHKQ